MKALNTFAVMLCFVSSAIFAQEQIDYDAISRIKKEGMDNSKIEEIAFYLTDVSGPRLSNSPGLERASKWAIREMEKWGMQNATLEPWGEFGKGWEVERSYLAMTEPYYMPFIAVPKAWTGSTKGEISGEVILVDIQEEEDFEKYRGKLKNKIILVASDYDITASFEADGNRFTDEELKEMEKYPSASGGSGSYADRIAQWRAMRAFRNKVDEFMANEGAALTLTARRGRHGTLFTSNGASYAADAAEAGPEFEVAPEFTNMMKRLLEAGKSVKVEAEVKTKFYDKDLQGYNVIAEIPGSDPELKDEVVMIGGHLDSWHGSTGATDNASGCAVMMEAARIIKSLGLQPKRTIRVALWTGEEQGIHGSRNYVQNHFGDRETMELTEEHDKLSAYYNIDNGTGRIRGVYLQGNEAARPVFEQWFSAMADIVETPTVTIRNTGGTDHLGFDAIGLPGFQFIQDEVEYNTRTHHTNMDSYDRLEMDDLKQMATVIAIITYHTAQREDLMPREPLPVVSSSN